MLKVFQINAVDSTASTGTVMRDIQDVCIHSGIECHIAYCDTVRSRHDILNGYHIGNWFDHKLHALLSRLSDRQAYWSTIPTLRLLHHIDAIEPDIVHLHNLHNNYINLNLLLHYLAKRDIATVITLHDNWFYTGGCCLYVDHECSNWQSGCHTCRYHRHAAKIFQDRKRYFLAIPRLHLVGVSDWMTHEVSKSFLKEPPVTTVRNGVRTDIFVPLTPEGRREVRHHFSISDDEFIILGPASKWLQPSNAHGLQTILDNLKPDERLFLYGCTPQQMTQPLDKRVTLIPFTPHKTLLSTYYSMADLFINCTRMDTCSFINIESQACGTPVITFNNTGAAETVDNHSSFSVPTDDFDAMVRKIAEIRSNSISDCRKWVENNFDMTKNYKSYIDIYNSL